MPELSFNYVTYGLLSFFMLSVGGNAWTVYKTTKMESTIQEQLSGKLAKTAKDIASLNESVGTITSKMVKRSELDSFADEIIGGLGEKTQSSIRSYMGKTGARIDDISERFVKMEGDLDKGTARIGSRTTRARDPKPKPPESWKGVTRDDQHKCEDHPERCEPFQFTWESPFSINGRPIYTFSSENLWEKRGKVSLNLAFKVVAMTFREGDRLGDGAVQNQGVHVMAGYISPKGGFIPIPGLESKLLRGDSNLDPRLKYVPKVDAGRERLGLSLFEPSLLVGSTYQGGGFGLSVGGSFVNFYKGDYRIGANLVLTEDTPYLGANVTWHPRIAGKNLNIAPSLGWVIDKEGGNTWSLGVHFQVW
jgi:hypothetical protein